MIQHEPKYKIRYPGRPTRSSFSLAECIETLLPYSHFYTKTRAYCSIAKRRSREHHASQLVLPERSFAYLSVSIAREKLCLFICLFDCLVMPSHA